ncbi:MAG: enoyl-CoA hydratase [Acidimicrobiales bacterium]|nr:enoyl-CoA hydratase [Acidimicrobiales bacterium]
MSESEEILVDQVDDIATVTLNRPQVKNAVQAEGWLALKAVFDELKYDPSVRAVVLTGAGGDFCSGADVSAMGNRARSGESGPPPAGLLSMQQVGECILALHEMPKPTIAKVDGVAAGAGMNMALGCDLIVASDRARFSEIFARRGLSIDGGGSWLLPRLVGLHKAKELVLLADVISAQEAADLGVVNRVVPADDLDGFVADWAARLAAGPPVALSMSKAMLNNSFSLSMAQAVQDEGRAQTVNFGTHDIVEAAMAWVEKRAAKFEGR